MEYNFDLGIDAQDEFVRQSRRFTVDDLLQKSARIYADRVAVSEPDREVTYAELNDRVNAVANALRERGLEPGEATIAVLSENRGEFIEVMFTGAKLGCLVPALNWRLEREELIHCVDLVDPDVLFVSEQYRERAEWVEVDADATPTIVGIDGRGDVTYENLVQTDDTSEPAPNHDIDPEQGLVVLYTSGTTGLPKGVVISHRAWLARGYTYIIDFGLQKGDGQLAWPPLFHIVSADWLPAVFTLGGTFYPIQGFDTERIVDVLQQDDGGIGWMVLLPGVVERLLNYIEENDLDPVSEFREIRNIGALVDLIDPKKVERVTELFDMPFKNSYGATENGNVLSAGNDIPKGVRPTDDDLPKTESSFVDLKLVDENWNEVEGRGELATRGPTLSSGYIRNEAANRADFNDGWFRTGDIFVHDEDDGTYHFVNRRKYLIKSGGENIYPAEIEKILLEQETIEEAIVVRVSDDKWGEVPHAVVSTYDPDAVSTDDLMATLEQRLANYKLPQYFDVVHPDDFPRSATGKVVREDVEGWDVGEDSRVREV